MKTIITICFGLIINLTTTAQITKVELQASGLTCSMCNKSIHKALTSIDNVKNVDANINTNTFTITFKDSTIVKMDDLKEKVEKAGYKVANFWATINLTNVAAKNDAHFTEQKNIYHFLNVKEQTLNGAVKVQVLDKGFVTSAMYKKNAKLTKMECYKTGFMEACCKVDNAVGKQRIFHITI
jgi:copper chaperone CopZ